MSPELLATFVAGIVAVPLLQVFKRYTKLSGTPMAFAAYVLSWPIAGFALITLGQVPVGELFASPELLALHGSTVAALAMVVYRAIAEKMHLGG